MNDPFYRKALRFRPVWALVLGLLALAVSWEPAMAQQYRTCTVSSGNIALGEHSSFEIAASPQTSSGAGGLACGVVLDLLGASFVKVKVENSTFKLTGGPDNQTINFVLSATENGTPITSGSEFDMSDGTLLTLLSSTGRGLPLYVRTNTQQALKAGTYTGAVNLRWYFSICTVGAITLCLLASESPFFSRAGGTVSNWGTGVPTTVMVTMKVTNDCVIAAPDIDFGQAPFAANFNAVTGTILIRCSAGASYSVGLNDGNYYNGGWRRMRNTAKDEYLQYDIYQAPSFTQRWGGNGAERRSSSTADTNPGVYDGASNQSFIYRARINPNQATPSAGTYKDSIVLDVQF